MTHLLDNISWHALTGPHDKYAAGTDAARRYAPGFSPILGFATPEQPRFDELVRYCEPGEHFYCTNWSGPAPEGWRIEAESLLCKMVWEGGPEPADEATGAERLGPQHAAEALELARLTQPGPFGLRTLELGDYYGYFDGGRLVAMAGERMQAGTLHEISGVCTHPQYQGRGLAQRLVARLLVRQLHRGETPFLHVMSANASARRLYRRLGFCDYEECVVRVIARS